MSDPTNFDVSRVPPTSFYQDRMGHTRNGRMESINVGYLDGHVDLLPASAVTLRYLSGNAWNCR